VFRNITLHVAPGPGPDDGRESTETCCPIEFVYDTPVIGTKHCYVWRYTKQTDLTNLLALTVHVSAEKFLFYVYTTGVGI
jgi:hypothetical protein